MKLRFLPWLLFFIWANGFICLGLETYPAIEYEIFNFSTAIFRGKEIQGLSNRIDLAAEGDAKVHTKKNDMFQPIGRGQRGKGGFGGANIAHRRPRKKSAAASLVRPDLSVSAASLAKVHAKKNDMFQPIGRGQRGKGGFGGANIAHGRPRKKSAAASLVRPDLSVSAASLVLMLILPSFFLRLI